MPDFGKLAPSYDLTGRVRDSHLSRYRERSQRMVASDNRDLDSRLLTPLSQSPRVLLDCLGFAGKQRFIRGKIGCSKQSEIGANPVSRFRLHDVAWRKLLSGDFLLHSVSPSLDDDLKQLLEVRRVFLGFSFLKGPECRIEQHNAEDERRVLYVADYDRSDAGGGQNVNRRANKLLKKSRPRRSSRPGGKYGWD